MSVIRSEILVLGAGPSGLACADRLAAAGADFRVLEASGRVGGRALSDERLVPGAPVELGAQMVHGRTALQHRLAAEVGLTIRRWPTVQGAVFVLNRAPISFWGLLVPFRHGWGWTALNRGLRTIPKKIKYYDGPDVPLSTFLQPLRPGPGARLLIELLHAHTYAADPDQIGVLGPGSEERRARERFGFANFRLVEGYSEFFRRRAAPHRSRIDFNARATHVEWGEDGVRVTTAPRGGEDPGVYEADRLVVTLPLGILQANRVVFEPELPEPKRRAIQVISFADALVVHLRTEGGTVRERLHDPAMIWGGTPSSFLRPFAGQSGMPEVMNAFTVGRPARALAALDDDALVRAIVEEFDGIAPAGVRLGTITGVSLHRWTGDPLTLGAYSYLGPGSSIKDRETLAEPVLDRLFFAGEATHSQGDSATVSGAIETGYRAAEEVLGARVRS